MNQLNTSAEERRAKWLAIALAAEAASVREAQRAEAARAREARREERKAQRAEAARTRPARRAAADKIRYARRVATPALRALRSEANRARYAARRDEMRAYHKARYNPEKARERKQNSRKRNPFHYKLQGRAQAARRRAMLLRAYPLWMDGPEYYQERRDIRTLYAVAANLSEMRGEEYQVDHLYPLCGKECSGLHVFTNLRIITAKENARKQNNFPGQIVNHIVDSNFTR